MARTAMNIIARNPWWLPALMLLVLFAALVAVLELGAFDAIAFFAKVQIVLAYMGLTLPMALFQLFGAGLVAFVLVLFWRAQHAPKRVNPFDVTDMFQENGKTSAGSVFKVVAGFTSVWVIGWLTISDKLTWDVFLGWLTILYLGKALDTYVRTRDGNNSAGGPPPPPVLNREGGEHR
jgi:hypothetical protein